MLLALALTTQTWTMVVGGEIMLNGVKPSGKTFAGIKAWTTKADIATANLEIPLTNSRTATVRKTPSELRARTQYILKADPGHVKWLADAGFDVVGLGNNHSMDYGWNGLQGMQKLLDKNGIEWCGAGKNAEEATAPRILRIKNGLKIAFVSIHAFRTDYGLWKCTPATEKSPGVATLAGVQVANGGDVLSRRQKAIVGEARKQADVVVVWLHWGTEKKSIPDFFQVKLGRGFIEAGADCVLGAHPHVLQGAENYAGKPLFYSLGNLVSPRPGSTAVFRLTFTGRKLVRTEMLPCSISGGRVAPVPFAQRQSKSDSFTKLSASSARKYKHPKALPLSVK